MATATNDRAAWLAARRTGIGGSDISSILGLNPWSTAVDVWLDKTGQRQDSFETNEAMYWGTTLEDVVAREYAQRTERRVQRVNQMLRHPRHEFLIGNIDRAILEPISRARYVNGVLMGAEGVLECKTASAYKLDDWMGSDASGGETIPAHYQAQGMWYLALTGLEWCDFAVLVGGQRYLTRRLLRDEETIAGMIARADEFWRCNVLERIPPEPQSGRDVQTLFPRDDGNMRDVSQAADVLERINELKVVRAQGDELAAREAELRDALQIDIGAHSGLSIDGSPLITWKAAKPGKQVDWQGAFSALAPLYEEARAAQATPASEVLQQHTTTKPGSRRFVIK